MPGLHDGCSLYALENIEDTIGADSYSPRLGRSYLFDFEQTMLSYGRLTTNLHGFQEKYRQSDDIIVELQGTLHGNA